MFIRKANTADRDQLVKLRMKLQQHVEQANPSIWRVTKAGRNKLVQDVDQMLSDDTGFVLVSENTTHIVGFVYGKILHRTEYMPKKVGFINMIFIQEGYRRRGIGTQLIHALYQYFDAENINHITLRYVLGNKEAEAFWQHLGFTPIIHTAHTNLETLKTHIHP